MVDLLDKVLNLGIGAIMMTKEKAEDMVNELIKKGEISQEQGKKMVKEIIEKGGKKKQELQEEIKRMIGNTLKEMNLAAKSDIDEIKSELEMLKRAKMSESEINEIKNDIAKIKENLGI